MTLFTLLINKIINPDNMFSYNNDGINSTIKIAFFNYITLNKNNDMPLYKQKFILYSKGLDSFMIKGCKEEEEQFCNYFNKIQRAYHALNRFAYIYKYKKSPNVVNTDMELNDIYETDKNVICIYQNNAKYLFKLNDLLKIINMSLINSHEFFAEPLPIKNPYNNIPFSKNILYYTHYVITEKTNIGSKISKSELFLKFHSCHFNLTMFLGKYEYLLREYTIHNHVKNSLPNILYNEIMIMISNFNKLKTLNQKIKIDVNFPKDKIVKIFRPYLNLYMNGKYLLIPQLKKDYLYELNKKLIRFQKFNPLFGRFKYLFERKICKNGTVRAFRIGEEYNIKHITFEEKTNNEKFLQDHLTYKYKNYINNSLYYIITNVEDGPEDNDDDILEDDDYDSEDDSEDDNNNTRNNNDNDNDNDTGDDTGDDNEDMTEEDIIFEENSETESLS